MLETPVVDFIDIVMVGYGVAKVGMSIANIGFQGMKAAARSSARAEAANLAEQLTLQEAKAGAGGVIMAGKIMDPKFPPELWAKIQHLHELPDKSNIVIHYWQSRIDDSVRIGFKFVK